MTLSLNLACRRLVCSVPCYEAIEALIQLCPDAVQVANNDGYRPLHYVCYFSSLQIIELLAKQLSRGCSQSDSSDGRARYYISCLTVILVTINKPWRMLWSLLSTCFQERLSSHDKQFQESTASQSMLFRGIRPSRLLLDQGPAALPMVDEQGNQNIHSISFVIEQTFRIKPFSS
jgi:hypothetical protein